MRLKSTAVIVGSILVAVIGFSFVGCGSTSGGSEGDKTFDGTSFVDSDGNTGTIKVKVKDTELQVGDKTGFFVEVKDADGGPVENITISCDSEAGVAIIEPSNGSETTSKFGEISGTIGCQKVGSYLFGCRLPVGANKREFVTMKCSGPIPNGFNGFPGAGGGNLGGESSNTDGGTGLKIVNIALFDSGSVTTTFGGAVGDEAIDVVQGNGTSGVSCGTPPTTVEPFFDTILGIDVENDTSLAVNFSSFKYTVNDSDGQDTRFDSSNLALSNADEVLARTCDSSGKCQPSQKRFIALFLKASALKKRFTGNSVNIPGIGTEYNFDLGFQNVRFTINGVDSKGNDVSVTKTVAFSFGNFNRCGS